MHRESTKQIPHPDETAGIRDDTPRGGIFVDRISIELNLWAENKEKGWRDAATNPDFARRNPDVLSRT